MIQAKSAGRVRLVLHGTNSFTADLTRQCVGAGISKVNVNKLVLSDYLDYLANHQEGTPLTALLEEGVVKIQAAVGEQMDACGSSGVCS